MARMKITPAHFRELEALLGDVVRRNGQGTLARHLADLRKDERVEDVPKRYRWDLFWAIGFEDRQHLMDELYKYMDDSHLDTALRRIVQMPMETTV